MWPPAVGFQFLLNTASTAVRPFSERPMPGWWYPYSNLATVLGAENIQEQVFSLSSSSSPLRLVEGGSVKYIRPSSPSPGAVSRQLFQPLPVATNENIMGIPWEIFNCIARGGHSLEICLTQRTYIHYYGCEIFTSSGLSMNDLFWMW